MRKFALQTISTNLIDHIEAAPVKIRIFNFNEGVLNLSLAENTKQKTIIGAYDSSWIRIYDENDEYYDFITSDIFFTANDEGIMLLLAESTDFITTEFVGKMIIDFINRGEAKTLTSERYIDSYYNSINKEIRQASKRLQALFSATSQAASSRFDIEDTYAHVKITLTKKYLIDLVTKKIIKENKSKILNIIDW